MSGAWSVVFFNACPLVVLLPLLLFKAKMLVGTFSSTLLVSVLVGSAFTCYANALIETTVIRATMLFYLTPVWSTLIGVIWLSEPLTRARIISIFVAFAGLFLLLSNGDSTNTPLNIDVESLSNYSDSTPNSINLCVYYSAVSFVCIVAWCRSASRCRYDERGVANSINLVNFFAAVLFYYLQNISDPVSRAGRHTDYVRSRGCGDQRIHLVAG